MLRHLHKPYPPLSSVATIWKVSALVGAFVIIFVIAFKPFGLGVLGSKLYALAITYGATCFLIMAILNILVPLLFPLFFKAETWTTGKEITWAALHILIIGIANAALSVKYGLGKPTISYIASNILYTLLLGVFPSTVIVLLNQFRLEKKHRKVSTLITESLGDPKIIPPFHNNRFILESDSGKDVVDISMDSLCFIGGMENYVEVVFLENNIAKRQMIRTTLKKVLEKYKDTSALVKCHRSFIVNIAAVSGVTGNAQGFLLHFNHITQTVPVSRTLNKNIGQLFKTAV